MKKCELCGKEVQFLFRCSHCQKCFCAEHRIPESHACTEFKQIHSSFPTLTSREPVITWKSGVGSRFICPSCGHIERDCTSFDAETMTFKCRECEKEWTQKKGTFEHMPLSEPQKDETNGKKKKHRFF
jgi:predicted RNA-binding Zn-ribbon protein involved in translation (DUF1610 family)